MIGSVELSRTTRLLEIDLGLMGKTDLVLDALTRASVCLRADMAFVSTFPGQVALTTSAMLLARSGHTVFVDAPDTPMLGNQPPFNGAFLHEALVSFGADLFESPRIKIGKPIEASTIAFVFGDPSAGIGLRSKRLMTVGAGDWHAEVAHWPQPVSEPTSDWPIGPILAGILVATETFKAASQALIPLSADPAFARELLAPSLQANIDLTPSFSVRMTELGKFDLISAGAITNAVLYALMRIPGVTGTARAFDDDESDYSNLNRNALLRRSDISGGDGLHRTKVSLLHRQDSGLIVDPVKERFTLDTIARHGGLRPHVLMGVDHIPARWDASRLAPQWLGVGATSHFSSMASFHQPFSACAGCLHPHNEPDNGPIPTVAFVSLLAGAALAAMFLRHLGGGETRLGARQHYITSLHPKNSWVTSVQPRSDCPAGCWASHTRAA